MYMLYNVYNRYIFHKISLSQFAYLKICDIRREKAICVHTFAKIDLSLN